MDNIIVGFRNMQNKFRSESQYERLVQCILFQALGYSEHDVRNATKHRKIDPNSPTYHIMRLLFPNSHSCYYSFTSEEFQLILLPFSAEIVCFISEKVIHDVQTTITTITTESV